jgi:hypothetical protein
MTKTYAERIRQHYQQVWLREGLGKRWHKGPLADLPRSFCVLEFPACEARRMWTYATCCMSQPDDRIRTELHLFSREPADAHIELLTAVAHYHRTGHLLGLGDTVNFGRPWLPTSACDHGLISSPYLDGPALQTLSVDDQRQVVSFLWLIPITRDEVEYKRDKGLEELERALEEARFDYLDPCRPSVIETS